MNEIWKSIKGYEGEYEVSSHGRVRSLNRLTWNGVSHWLKEGRVLTPRKTKTGYLRVQLNGRDYYIHRLVGETFIPNPDNKLTINHIDEDKSNNHVENLQWATQAENNAWSDRVERIAAKNRGKVINNIPIAQFDLDGNFISVYNSALEASRMLGIDNSTISKAVKGRMKTAGGFKWEMIHFDDER